MTPDHDLCALSTLRRDADAVSDELRGDLADSRCDVVVYRALYKAAFHAGCAAYDRIAVLERRVSELVDERERIARRIFHDAPPKEQV